MTGGRSTASAEEGNDEFCIGGIVMVVVGVECRAQEGLHQFHASKGLFLEFDDGSAAVVTHLCLTQV